MRTSGGQRDKGAVIPTMEAIPTVLPSNRLWGTLLLCGAESSSGGKGIHQGKAGASVRLFRGSNDYDMCDSILLFRRDRSVKINQRQEVTEANREGGRQWSMK